MSTPTQQPFTEHVKALTDALLQLQLTWQVFNAGTEGLQPQTASMREAMQHIEHAICEVADALASTATMWATPSVMVERQ